MGTPRHRAWRLVIVVAVLAVAPVALAQDADVFTVTRTDDPEPDGCRPDDCSLREAVGAANARPGADVVALRSGIFHLVRLDRTPTTGPGQRDSPTPTPTAGGAGQALYVTGELVLRGAGQLRTVIDFSGQPSIEEELDVLGPGIWAEDASLSIEDLTLRDANYNGNYPRLSSNSGALIAVETAVTMRSITVADNRGIRSVIVDNRHTGKSLLVQDSLFADNHAGALRYYGGDRPAGAPAVLVQRSLFEHNGGPALQLSVPAAHRDDPEGHQAVVEDSRFTGNTTGIIGVGSIRVSRSSFVDHSAPYGPYAGAMDFQGVQPVLLEQLLVESNTAVEFGGGVRARHLVVRDSIFRANDAGLEGGAISVSAHGATPAFREVTGSALTGNSAGHGGAIHFRGGDARLTNVTLSGNEASELRLRAPPFPATSPGGQGAALYLGESSTASLVHSTLVGNQGDFGTVHTASPLTLVGSVLAKTGTSAGFPAPNCVTVDAGAVVSGGFNLADDDSCGLVAGGDQVRESELGPLVSTGGTVVHVPLPGSPLVDGVDAACPVLDQRRLTRPVDGDGDGTPLCDVGAVEALSGRVGRVAGTDRVATAVAVSRASVPARQAGVVVLARADGFADGLAGGPLAAAENGPLLLTGRDRLDLRVEAELSRVLPEGGEVVLLGGPAALKSAVEDRVAELGYRPVRVMGTDRYGTAVSIARRLGEPNVVLLASGTDFPDALSAAAAAATVKGAVLLTADDQLPAPTRGYLEERPEIQRIAVGGPAAAAAPGSVPLLGPDRYATAVAIARRFHQAPSTVGVASGTTFPDALAAAPDSAGRRGPLLLSPSDGLPEVVEAYLREVAQTLADTAQPVRIYGGEKALSLQVEAELDGEVRP